MFFSCFAPVNSTVCPEDNGWPEALVDHTAIKFCDSNSVGLQTRECMLNKTWASIIPDCVNKDISILLQDALVSIFLLHP